MGRQRLVTEEDSRASLAAGELGLDVYGRRQKLVDMDVEWVDTLDDLGG